MLSDVNLQLLVLLTCTNTTLTGEVDGFDSSASGFRLLQNDLLSLPEREDVHIDTSFGCGHRGTLVEVDVAQRRLSSSVVLDYWFWHLGFGGARNRKYIPLMLSNIFARLCLCGSRKEGRKLRRTVTDCNPVPWMHFMHFLSQRSCALRSRSCGRLVPKIPRIGTLGDCSGFSFRELWHDSSSTIRPGDSFMASVIVEADKRLHESTRELAFCTSRAGVVLVLGSANFVLCWSSQTHRYDMSFIHCWWQTLFSGLPWIIGSPFCNKRLSRLHIINGT